MIHTSQLIALTLGLYFINFKSQADIQAAVSKLKSGRAVGFCNIPAELMKAWGGTLSLTLCCGNLPQPLITSGEPARFLPTSGEA